ncbi:hypothetical protein E4U53_002665 [Claviceps sorghi]|nr:hypothetical protein E4U53_002665 [Claviceps sorghi]
MKSSLLVAASALLASASPLHKRAIVTDWVTKCEYVTVYDNGNPTPLVTPAPAVFAEKPAPKNPPPAAEPDVPPKVVKPVSPPAVTPPPPAPKVKAHKVKTPKVKAPEVKVPDVKAPEVKVPEVKAPEVKAPEVNVPEAKAPEVKVPEVKNKTPKNNPAPQPATQPAPANQNLDAYAKAVVEQHMLHRRNHSCPHNIEWDDDLAKWALNTAKTCVFEHDMKQGTGDYGQNLASMGSTESMDGKEVQSVREAITNQWYNGEFSFFNPFYGLSQPPNSLFMKTGHLTQLIWKGTQKVGCATVKCGAGTIFGMQSTYSVCNYWPAGNYEGQYSENVLPPIGMSPVVV